MHLLAVIICILPQCTEMDHAKKRHEVWARDFSLCTCSDTQTVLGFTWRLALGGRIRIQ